LEKFTGRYFYNCREEQPAAAAKKYTIAKLLWAESKKWTGLDISKMDKLRRGAIIAMLIGVF